MGANHEANIYRGGGEKPFTSSFNIFPEAGVGGVTHLHHYPTFPADPWIFHVKTTQPFFSSSVFPSMEQMLQHVVSIVCIWSARLRYFSGFCNIHIFKARINGLYCTLIKKTGGNFLHILGKFWVQSQICGKVFPMRK